VSGECGRSGEGGGACVRALSVCKQLPEVRHLHSHASKDTSRPRRTSLSPLHGCSRSCLRSLAGLKDSAYLATASRIPKIRLQAELHALTKNSGPRSLSRPVNKAAVEVLDALFPKGRIPRRLVSLAFRWLVQPPLDFLYAVSSVLRSVTSLFWNWCHLLWGLFGRRLFRRVRVPPGISRGPRRPAY
jgi:hypothetical protein